MKWYFFLYQFPANLMAEGGVMGVEAGGINKWCVFSLNQIFTLPLWKNKKQKYGNEEIIY